MGEHDDDTHDDEIKVTDRRLFTADGERSGREEPPDEAEEEAPAQAAGEATRGASFETLVFGLASTALIHLGQIDDPSHGGGQVNLPAAREAIDLLAVLQEKTAGNLTPEEHALLENFLFKLRMDFSQKAAAR